MSNFKIYFISLFLNLWQFQYYRGLLAYVTFNFW